jgi:prevent-host-death family protein
VVTVTVQSVPAVELRRHLSEYLDETRSGEGFVITRNGRPAARLVPPDVEGRSATAREDDQ